MKRTQVCNAAIAKDWEECLSLLLHCILQYLYVIFLKKSPCTSFYARLVVSILPLKVKRLLALCDHSSAAIHLATIPEQLAPKGMSCHFPADSHMIPPPARNALYW